MSDNNAQKGLTGPFQSTGNPESYYMFDKDGNQIAPSTDLLFAGTVTAVVIEEDEPDPDTALKAEQNSRMNGLREEGLQTMSMTVAPR